VFLFQIFECCSFFTFYDSRLTVRKFNFNHELLSHFVEYFCLHFNFAKTCDKTTTSFVPLCLTLWTVKCKVCLVLLLHDWNHLLSADLMATWHNSFGLSLIHDMRYSFHFAKSVFVLMDNNVSLLLAAKLEKFNRIINCLSVDCEEKLLNFILGWMILINVFL